MIASVLPMFVAAASLYVLLLVVVYFYQPRLIYFPDVPGRELTAAPDSLGLAFEDVRIPSGGETLHAWYVPAGAGAPVVLFCHGNAGNIAHRLEWLEILHGMGLAVLLFDYRGYGQSSGSPDEHGMYEDARAAWSYLASRQSPGPPVVIFGESLGGAVAANLASTVQPAALVISSTFTSAPDLASRFYWYLPVRLLARFKYPTADFVEAVRAPILVMHSRDDEIVPFGHGEAIFARAREPKQFLELLGDHNSGFLVSGPRLADGLRGFLVRHGVLPPANTE
jgi:uncharacterized protein